MELETFEEIARLSAIVESSEDAIISIKPDGRISSWNLAAENIYGYPAEEAIGQNISIIIPGEILKKEWAVIEKVIKGYHTEHYETVRKKADGNTIVVSLTVSPIKGTLGNVIGISKIARDITEQKLAEEKQAMLAAIVSSSDDAIISKTLDGIITSWNGAAVEMFGFSESEAIGSHITIIIPPDRIHEETMIINHVRNGRKIDHIETVRVAKDGKEVNVSLTVSPIKNKKGEIIGASKVARNINFRKLAEEKQAILAAIVVSSDDAIISKTLNGIITSWNHAAEKMFGYTESEAVGSHITTIIPLDRMDEEAMIINNIRNGKKIDHIETVRVAKDGKEVNISLTVSPVRNDKGKVIGASKVARDISEKIELERQRQLYTKRLQELNQYKDDFMAMASHELKTPLTVILVNLQLLEFKMTEDANIEYVKRILKMSNKLSDLINDLFDVTKIQSGKLDLTPSVFNLNILLKETCHNLQQTTPKHLIICNECSEELTAYADRDRIEQVIINILGNAIKYSPNAGEIIVDSSKEDGKIKVSIADKGIGIPQEDLQNVFSRFYRVSGTAASFSGSGIGLYISSEIISRHGGDIWAESKTGEGTVVYFTLPAAK